MSKYTDDKFGLTPRPKDERKKTCGICEGEKKELLGDEGVLICEHCDSLCPTPPDESCPICRSGMAGMPDPEVREWWKMKEEG